MIGKRKRKNPLYRASKMPTDKFHMLLWMFSFNRSAEHVAQTLGLSPRSVYGVYSRLRERMTDDELFLQDITIAPDTIPPEEHIFWKQLQKYLHECPGEIDDEFVTTKALPDNEIAGSQNVKWILRHHMKTKVGVCTNCHITGIPYDKNIRIVKGFKQWISAFGGIPEQKLRHFFVHFIVVKNLEYNLGPQLRVTGKIGTSSVATMIYSSLIASLRRNPL